VRVLTTTSFRDRGSRWRACLLAFVLLVSASVILLSICAKQSMDDEQASPGWYLARITKMKVEEPAQANSTCPQQQISVVEVFIPNAQPGLSVVHTFKRIPEALFISSQLRPRSPPSPQV
jgi:hypothetical protein